MTSGPKVMVDGVEVSAKWTVIQNGIEVPVASWSTIQSGIEVPLA